MKERKVLWLELPEGAEYSKVIVEGKRIGIEYVEEGKCQPEEESPPEEKFRLRGVCRRENSFYNVEHLRGGAEFEHLRRGLLENGKPIKNKP